MKRKLLITLLISCIALSLSVCSRETGQKPTEKNVLIILSDALRADHMGTYGYDRNTTPAIDRLAKESVVFIRAFGQNHQ